MKNLTSSLFILFTFSFFAQQDQVFPNSEAYYVLEIQTFDNNLNWVYDYDDFEIWEQSSSTDTLDVVHHGDLIANLYPDGEKVMIKQICSTSTPGFHGFRNDFGCDYEVLYDFSLQIGDTAYSTFFTSFFTVESIDTITLNGIDRKRLNLSNGEAWIKGMGSTFHPLSSKMRYFEISYRLCNSYMLFEDDIYSTFTEFNGPCNNASLSEIQTDNNLIIFPNPSSGENVVISNDFSIETIHIYNSVGKLVYKNENVNSNELSLQHLIEGIYYVQIRANDQIESRKLIITK